MEKKARDQAKKAEADKLFVEAKESAKSGLFKKPDWEKAARCFKEAADKYRSISEDLYVNQIVECFKGCADASNRTNDIHTAAASLEKAANLLAKDAKKTSEAVKLWKESANCYRLNNAPDKAAQVLTKAADLLTDTDTDNALKLMKDACMIFEDEKRGEFSDATFKKAIALAVKKEKFEEAIQLLLRHNETCERHLSTFEKDIYTNLLQIIVIRFATHQYDQALTDWAKFSNIRNFSSSKEWECGEELMAANRNASQEDLEKAKKSSLFKYLLAPVARLVPKLKFTEEKLKMGPIEGPSIGGKEEGDELDLT